MLGRFLFVALQLPYEIPRTMLRTIVFDLGNTLIEQKIDAICRLDQMELDLMPGVRNTLRILHARYKIGLLSNTMQSDAQSVGTALEHLLIRRYFKAIVTSVDIGTEKPNPRAFFSVLQAMDASPEESIMIGNDRLQDIQPAKRLGMKTAYFTPLVDPTFFDADIQFSHFHEIPELISTLEE